MTWCSCLKDEKVLPGMKGILRELAAFVGGLGDGSVILLVLLLIFYLLSRMPSTKPVISLDSIHSLLPNSDCRIDVLTKVAGAYLKRQADEV